MKTGLDRIPSLAVAVAAALSVMSVPLHAAQVGFDLSVIVPEVCFVRPLAPAMLQDNAIVISQVQETCNRGGYRVSLEYTPGTLAGSTASFAGSTVALDGSGRVDLLAAPYAVNRTSALIIDLGDNAPLPAGIALQMNPL